ncbi:MAG TPA: DUF4258 domain-containing protein [Lacipirellulaceae bacterium]|nr:DUF4258 domain-containing protein [Lacipirellulaceae bacterium]
MAIRDSTHFATMIRERGIELQWANDACETPDAVEPRNDGTTHYLKKIEAFGNRWLRVIVNASTEPAVRITAFFDRRLSKDDESTNRPRE